MTKRIPQKMRKQATQKVRKQAMQKAMQKLRKTAQSLRMALQRMRKQDTQGSHEKKKLLDPAELLVQLRAVDGGYTVDPTYAIFDNLRNKIRWEIDYRGSTTDVDSFELHFPRTPFDASDFTNSSARGNLTTGTNGKYHYHVRLKYRGRTIFDDQACPEVILKNRMTEDDD